MSQNQGEIYLITNKINNKKYIGQTVSRLSSGRKYGYKYRWNKHINDAKNFVDDCKAFCNALRKYGKDNFSIELLLFCNIKELDYYETKFIELYNTISPHGYNIENGGTNGKIMHQETKDKLSKYHRFLHISEENKDKILKAMEELNIKEIPIGVNFTSNNNSNLCGFIVKKKNNTYKYFTSKQKSLKEKLIISLEYYSYVEKDSLVKMIEIEEKYNYDIKMSIRTKKISKDFKNILEKMNLKIEELSSYIYYEKRSDRFYVNIPGKGCKYFTKNDHKKSLFESIEYINSLQSQRESA